jgi:hypothetical protein
MKESKGKPKKAQPTKTNASQPSLKGLTPMSQQQAKK